jgi:hypothetical protein
MVFANLLHQGYEKMYSRIFILVKAWGHFKVEEQYGLILQHLSIFKHKYKNLATFCHPHPVLKNEYIIDTTLRYSRRWAGEIGGGHIPRKQLRKREGPSITVFTVKEAHSAFPFSSPLPLEKHQCSKSQPDGAEMGKLP